MPLIEESLNAASDKKVYMWQVIENGRVEVRLIKESLNAASDRKIDKRQGATYKGKA